LLWCITGNTESAASLFDARPGGHSRGDALSMALAMGTGAMSSAYGSYMGMGMGYDQNDEDYYDQDGEEDEEGENDDDEELDGEDYYHLRHMTSGSGKAGSKPIYGFPSTYPHGGECYPLVSHQCTSCGCSMFTWRHDVQAASTGLYLTPVSSCVLSLRYRQALPAGRRRQRGQRRRTRTHAQQLDEHDRPQRGRLGHPRQLRRLPIQE
jgi:hypothetical protein